MPGTPGGDIGMTFSWSIFLDFGLISLALLIATLVRAKVPFFQRYLIPNALTAGFLLLPFYNFLAPRIGMNSDGLGNLVFHLLNLSFIAMSLKEGSMKGSGKRIFATAVTIVSQYTIQVIVGLALTALIIVAAMPKLFLNFGFFLALGYGLGPGQSFAIGKAWESSGFENAGNLGLIFAAMGYIWGCIGGVYLINYGRSRGWLEKKSLAGMSKKELRTGIYGPKESLPVGALLHTDTEAIDSMSYNLAIILAIYLVTYVLLRGITYPVSLAGAMGKQLADTLWGISFIFAAVIALFVKRLMKAARIDYTLDEGSLNRIAGASVDVMVTASVATITIVTVSHYWMPIVVIGIVGGIITTITCIWTCSRLFEDHKFGRSIMIYGNMTGTLSTGLALLRVIDPEFASPVASDYMFASGITFALAIPMVLLINLPIYWHTTGNPIYLWLTILGFALYAAFSLIAYRGLAGKKAFRDAGKIWYEGK
jgi:ESS family glutamate:Na+ symporter